MNQDLRHRIGFMQGRLSLPTHGRIQCFPETTWKDELYLAQENGFRLMEWTLDRLTWEGNPLLTIEGRREILDHLRITGIQVPSLTGDFFMEDPFSKAEGQKLRELSEELDRILEACHELKTRFLVLPLVDGGRIESQAQEDLLCSVLMQKIPLLEKLGMEILFESDYSPPELRRFLSRLPVRFFGLNYDIGNSASLGFSPSEELSVNGRRVRNVHVKDRRRGGTTVSLGSGNADFRTVFEQLSQVGYGGNYILQTARGGAGSELSLALGYRDQVVEWIEQWSNPWTLDFQESVF